MFLSSSALRRRGVAPVVRLRDDGGVTTWEYAKLVYGSTGSLGNDKHMDFTATFHSPAGAQNWGTDERFDDLRHLNRAGAAGWQAYDRAGLLIGQPQRLHSVTYSMRRPVKER